MCEGQINCRSPSDIIEEFYGELLFSAANHFHPASTKIPPWPEVKVCEKREYFTLSCGKRAYR
jgi:hypothetical protein